MSDYTSLLRRHLWGILKWEDWERLRLSLVTAKDPWYVYCVGQSLPADQLRGEELSYVLEEINTLLRREHDEEYLGIVYVDDIDAPSIIKIYDPNNLCSSCGSSGGTVPPGWVLSKIRPNESIELAVIPLNRKRWWQDLMARFRRPSRQSLRTEN